MPDQMNSVMTGIYTGHAKINTGNNTYINIKESSETQTNIFNIGRASI